MFINLMLSRRVSSDVPEALAVYRAVFIVLISHSMRLLDFDSVVMK